MEINPPGKYIYSDIQLDREEGRVIENLKANSQEPTPTPTSG